MERSIVGSHSGPGINRRSFLRNAAAALPLAYAAGGQTLVAHAAERASAPDNDAAFPGVIVRQSKPENYEFPFPTLSTFHTPNNLFYVRTHFGIFRDVDLAAWKLKVEGHIERPLELSYEELLKLPSRTQSAVLECSGNSRVFLVPRAEGVPWELGAVSNAEWTGVPLAAVLDQAGVKSGAVEVICEGADAGEIGGNKEEPMSPGKISYARSLPLDKARKSEVLLAYKMNGVDLPAAHGFPLRVLVPGWYGMASVKWLRRLIVTDQPFQGFFQTMAYSYYERRAGNPALVPTTELNVKAQIARPARQEIVRADTAYRVHGAAWTGESEIARVEFSADGGKTWADAKLLDKSVPYAWRLWEYSWQTPQKPGSLTLMVRATDARGRAQPMKRDPDRRNALVNHVLPMEIEVR
ncbi:MAG TPA: sulfite oxidase [Gemmataceae bacterium]|jgi:DMSO/TMAO reductase YedYZ molybdopterin-dependent catalytic subunit|nr:sulfite oxidase [Gemmataceae bacterium]